MGGRGGRWELAKWPDYFAPAWQGLRTFVGTESWRGICETAEWIGELAAVALPATVRVSPKEPGELGLESQDVDDVAAWIDTFHRLLPGLIVNTSYLWVGLRSGSERETPLPGAFEQSADER